MSTTSVKLKDGEKSVAAWFKKLSKSQRDTASALHELILKAIPNAEPKIKWGSPWYELNGENIAYLAGVAKRINLGFPRGAELESELLEGTGKGMRHIKVANVEEIKPKSFTALLKSAAKLPTEKTKPTTKKATAQKTAAKKSVAKSSGAHGWTLNQLMAEMKKRGTAQAVKIYKRHGMSEPLYGVSFADLYKFRNEIKRDHELALQLWNTGNGDAKHLATMIADPGQFKSKQLDSLVKGQNCTGVCDLTGGLVAKTKFAREKADKWICSNDEWIGRTGWNVVSALALDPNNGLPDSYFEDHLKTIRNDIHGAKNFTRHMMNLALISIGGRNTKLRKLAEEAAKRIGKVEVDHGETDCKTPEAIPYIAKIWARKQK
jgi:3-methyladenine DNA glycosylase AlkD